MYLWSNLYCINAWRIEVSLKECYTCAKHMNISHLCGCDSCTGAVVAAVVVVGVDCCWGALVGALVVGVAYRLIVVIASTHIHGECYTHGHITHTHTHTHAHTHTLIHACTHEQTHILTAD